MFKLPGNIQELMEQAKKMQEGFTATYAELEKKEVEASSGGGMVCAKVNGTGLLTGIVIDRTVVDPNDIQMLQDLVLAAVNEAIRKSKQEMKEEMSKLTGGIPIPGL